MYVPTTIGEYATMYFVTGFRGVMPAESYDDFNSFVASHGFERSNKNIGHVTAMFSGFLDSSYSLPGP